MIEKLDGAMSPGPHEWQAVSVSHKTPDMLHMYDFVFV